jgi:hypothetical protein
MACTATSSVNVGLRRKYDHAYLELPVDPEWGIPVPNCWVYLDTVTNYIRPFSSTDEVTDITNSPVKGVVQDFVRPGVDRVLVVWTCGVFQFNISAATEVVGGVTGFIPYLDGAAVSNTKFAPAGEGDTAILTAIQHGPCICQSQYSDACQTAGDVASESPTTPLAIANVTNAVGKFCL